MILAVGVAATVGGAAKASFPGVNGRIVFASDRGPNLLPQLFSVPAAGGRRRNLSRRPSFINSEPAPSPKAAAVLFTSTPAVGPSPPTISLREDGKVRKVANGRLSAWSPDATRILFTGNPGGLFVVGARGGAPRRVADTGSPGVWSPGGQWIAFTDGFGISLVRSDGGATRMLASNLEIPNDSLPSWSPDGKRLTVAARLDTGSTELNVYIIDTETGGTKQLIDGVQPQWSPDDDLVAFARANGVGIIHPDGTDFRTLTTPARGAADSYPSWSPDGGRLAFVRGKTPFDSQASEVGIVDISDGEVRLLTPSKGNLVQGYPRGPVWSAGGRTLFYSSRATDNRFHLFTVDRELQRLKQLTRGSGNDRDPTWAPDGRRLAFVRNGTVLELKSDNRIHPLARARALSSPTWSPDGRRLAYAAAAAIWVINADGSGRRRVTDGRNPAWSPVGRWLAFERDGLHVIRSDGQGDRVVVPTTENNVPVDPTWSTDGRVVYYVEEHRCDWQCPPGGVLRGVRPFTLPRKVELPSGPAENPNLSPDGRLFVLDGLSLRPRSGFGTSFSRQTFATETEPDWQRLAPHKPPNGNSP